MGYRRDVVESGTSARLGQVVPPGYGTFICASHFSIHSPSSDAGAADSLISRGFGRFESAFELGTCAWVVPSSLEQPTLRHRWHRALVVPSSCQLQLMIGSILMYFIWIYRPNEERAPENERVTVACF